MHEAPGQPNRIRAVRTADAKYAIYFDPRGEAAERARDLRPRPRPARGRQPGRRARRRRPRPRRCRAARRAEGAARARARPLRDARRRGLSPARPDASAPILAPVALPPGPKTPATLNIFRFQRRPLDTLLRWQRRYGNVFLVKFPVFGTGVYVAEPEAIRDMFTGDQSDLHAGEANAPLAACSASTPCSSSTGPSTCASASCCCRRSGRAAERDAPDDPRGRRGRGRPLGDRFGIRDARADAPPDVRGHLPGGVRRLRARAIERLRAAMLKVIDTQSLFFVPEAVRRDYGRFSLGGWLGRRLERADALLFEEIARRRREADLEERADVLSLLLRARDEDGEPMTDVELRDELWTMLAPATRRPRPGSPGRSTCCSTTPRCWRGPRGDRGRGRRVPGCRGDRDIADPARDRRCRADPEGAADIAGWELPEGIRVYPGIALITTARTSIPSPNASGPSGSPRRGPSRTPGFRSGRDQALHRRGPGAGRDGRGPAGDLLAGRARGRSPRARAGRLKGITVAPRHGAQVRVTALVREPRPLAAAIA